MSVPQSTQWRRENPERAREHGRRWAAKHRAKMKEEYGTSHPEVRLKKLYGCTPEEFRDRMATSSCCEICGNTENLVYDHCHDSMAFRGVLCCPCNLGLGKLGDNLEGLQRAVKYLEKENFR